MLSDPGKPVNIYIVAGIIGKSFSKAFTILSIVNVTGVYSLNEGVSDESELSCFVTDRLYCQVRETDSASLDPNDNTVVSMKK
jgi:hypothetical protein